MTVPSWSAALSYALTGRRAEPPTEPVATPEALVDALGLETVVAVAEQCERDEQPWPVPLPVPTPPELDPGVGPAQWAALITRARTVVAAARSRAAGRTVSDRAPDADERRLQGEVPPHHGV